MLDSHNLRISSKLCRPSTKCSAIASRFYQAFTNTHTTEVWERFFWSDYNRTSKTKQGTSFGSNTSYWILVLDSGVNLIDSGRLICCDRIKAVKNSCVPVDIVYKAREYHVQLKCIFITRPMLLLPTTGLKWHPMNCRRRNLFVVSIILTHRLWELRHLSRIHMPVHTGAYICIESSWKQG